MTQPTEGLLRPRFSFLFFWSGNVLYKPRSTARPVPLKTVLIPFYRRTEPAPRNRAQSPTENGKTETEIATPPPKGKPTGYITRLTFPVLSSFSLRDVPDVSTVLTFLLGGPSVYQKVRRQSRPRGGGSFWHCPTSVQRPRPSGWMVCRDEGAVYRSFWNGSRVYERRRERGEHETEESDESVTKVLRYGRTTGTGSFPLNDPLRHPFCRAVLCNSSFLSTLTRRAREQKHSSLLIHYCSICTPHASFPLSFLDLLVFRLPLQLLIPRSPHSSTSSLPLQLLTPTRLLIPRPPRLQTHSPLSGSLAL
jgi:hypothetical protein